MAIEQYHLRRVVDGKALWLFAIESDRDEIVSCKFEVDREASAYCVGFAGSSRANPIGLPKVRNGNVHSGSVSADSMDDGTWEL